ncbi:Protein PafB [Rhodococcus sp. RD6.2]|uniref:helix-turn-helix transcriptional regulator n=1 Tax=Rhodococcus sp. RD6.2 TaxID=260936 RepID=UPI00063B246F|nr:YafY family protein [Rhodococcus sp. RD6.2]CRK51078.1 Protein PafB [Rhodococcus sp. RD6.2]
MATSKVERLMNLVICLLATRQFVTADKIRESVAGYQDSASSEAFSRMFERDKSELRDLGVPLETGPAAGFTSAEGYRINLEAYALPEIDLTSEESAAVAIALRLLESPEMTSAAQGAVLKLRAAGVVVDQESASALVTALPARSRGSEPALDSVLSAIEAGRAIRFEHRPAPNAPFATRTVEPWGVVTHDGRWYVVGHDVDRGAPRTFRLSRIAEPVVAVGPAGVVHKPAGTDLRDIVGRAVGTAGVSGTATVWVRDGRAQGVRRLGKPVRSATIGGEGGVVFEVPVRSRDWLARLIAGYGADAVVIEPAALRDDVIARLTVAAGETR